MTNKKIIILFSALLLLLIGAIVLSEKGMGNPSNDGEITDGGLMFFHGGTYHANPNVRMGSTNGPNFRGGGLHGGK